MFWIVAAIRLMRDRISGMPVEQLSLRLLRIFRSVANKQLTYEAARKALSKLKLTPMSYEAALLELAAVANGQSPYEKAVVRVLQTIKENGG
jgi:uncharacterized membrane protein YjjP (DUF1212 family)